MASVLRGQVEFVRNEPGCLAIEAYRSTRDSRLFYIHSRWIDEAAFDTNAKLANTLLFFGTREGLGR